MLILFFIPFAYTIQLLADMLQGNTLHLLDNNDCQQLLNYVVDEFGPSTKINEYLRKGVCGPINVNVPIHEHEGISELWMASVDWIRSNPILSNVVIDWGAERLSRSNVENESTLFDVQLQSNLTTISNSQNQSDNLSTSTTSTNTEIRLGNLSTTATSANDHNISNNSLIYTTSTNDHNLSYNPLILTKSENDDNLSNNSLILTKSENDDNLSNNSLILTKSENDNNLSNNSLILTNSANDHNLSINHQISTKSENNQNLSINPLISSKSTNDQNLSINHPISIDSQTINHTSSTINHNELRNHSTTNKNRHSTLPSLQKLSKSDIFKSYDNRQVQIIDQIFNDPMWPHMWYMNPKYHQARAMNIYGAWYQGYSGLNVRLAIIDDGVDHKHPDLLRNYDPQASFDVNDNDYDPMPAFTPNNINRHGTRCAGQIAAEANNSNCIIGVAFNSKIGGIRVLDGRVVDSVESLAIAFKPHYIDVYSASWGPRDNGQKLDGPGRRSLEALEEAATKGRKGLGSIYVWAAGNGGRDSDDCNCDGYTASPYTITVSSTTEHGSVPPYAESCSSILTSTYSSGNKLHGDKLISTTDLYGTCTEFHSGTSASAPMIAGIIALALEANPKLSWRDVQHLIIQSSFRQDLKDVWYRNGANLQYSPFFGFGLINADILVRKAKTWISVPERKTCAIHIMKTDHQVIPSMTTLKGRLMTAACGSLISRLEHVQLLLTIDSKRRGDLQITLISPSKTRSTVLHFRNPDISMSGFYRWPFMTVHFWNENPVGEWILEISNRALSEAYLTQWVLILHGY